MGRNYWMVSTTLDDFNVTRDRGYTILGMGSKYRRRAQRMQPDDRMLLYVRQLRKWTGVVSVTSSYFEDRTPIWNVGVRGENYPYRVKIKPEIVLLEEDYIDALLLAPRMEYLKRWLPETWPLAFFDTLHLIPQKDFSLIEGEMKRVIANNSRRLSRRRPQFRSNIANAAPTTVATEEAADRTDMGTLASKQIQSGSESAGEGHNGSAPLR